VFPGEGPPTERPISLQRRVHQSSRPSGRNPTAKCSGRRPQAARREAHAWRGRRRRAARPRPPQTTTRGRRPPRAAARAPCAAPCAGAAEAHRSRARRPCPAWPGRPRRGCCCCRWRRGAAGAGAARGVAAGTRATRRRPRPRARPRPGAKPLPAPAAGAGAAAAPEACPAGVCLGPLDGRRSGCAHSSAGTRSTPPRRPLSVPQ
jgi:hypothetical protein